MARKKKHDADVESPPSTVKACATCGLGTENEHETIDCPIEGGSVGRADSCGEWKPQGEEVHEEGTAPKEILPERPGHWTCEDCQNFNFPQACTMEDPNHVACDEFSPHIPVENCEECNNATPAFDHEGIVMEEVANCSITEDFQLAYESCPDWISPEDKKHSLSGRDLTSEIPGPRSTTDFHLYKIKDFEHELNVALFEVYNYLGKGGEGDPSITIKLTGFLDKIKAGMVVDLPHKVKLHVGSVETVRENGTFRIVLPDQPDMFEEPPGAETNSSENTFTIPEDQDGLSDEQTERLRAKVKEALEAIENEEAAEAATAEVDQVPESEQPDEPDVEKVA